MDRSINLGSISFSILMLILMVLVLFKNAPSLPTSKPTSTPVETPTAPGKPVEKPKPDPKPKSPKGPDGKPLNWYRVPDEAQEGPDGTDPVGEVWIDGKRVYIYAPDPDEIPSARTSDCGPRPPVKGACPLDLIKSGWQLIIFKDQSRPYLWHPCWGYIRLDPPSWESNKNIPFHYHWMREVDGNYLVANPAAPDHGQPLSRRQYDRPGAERFDDAHPEPDQSCLEQWKHVYQTAINLKKSIRAW